VPGVWLDHDSFWSLTCTSGLAGSDANWIEEFEALCGSRGAGGFDEALGVSGEVFVRLLMDDLVRRCRQTSSSLQEMMKSATVLGSDFRPPSVEAWQACVDRFRGEQVGQPGVGSSAPHGAQAAQPDVAASSPLGVGGGMPALWPVLEEQEDLPSTSAPGPDVADRRGVRPNSAPVFAPRLQGSSSDVNCGQAATSCTLQSDGRPILSTSPVRGAAVGRAERPDSSWSTKEEEHKLAVRPAWEDPSTAADHGEARLTAPLGAIARKTEQKQPQPELDVSLKAQEDAMAEIEKFRRSAKGRAPKRKGKGDSASGKLEPKSFDPMTSSGSGSGATLISESDYQRILQQVFDPQQDTPDPLQDTPEPVDPLTDMLGHWRFGNLNSFTLCKTPGGTVTIHDKRPDGTLLYGTLQWQDGWLQGSLQRDDTWEEFGTLRLRRHAGGRLVSNFKAPGSDDWERDVVADTREVTSSFEVRSIVPG